MSNENLIQRLDKLQQDFVEDIVYGKDEDIFIRNARQENFKKKYGNIHLTAWLPVWCTYVDIRDHLKSPKLTKKEKVILCAVDVGLELILDTIRAGGIYGLYKFLEYLS